MNTTDFNSYLRFGRMCMAADRRAGTTPLFMSTIKPARGVKSATDAFNDFDSNGSRVLSCKHPRVFCAVVYGKQILNFHITDLWGYTLSICAKEAGIWLAKQEFVELKDDFHYLPEWVWRALSSRVVKGAGLSKTQTRQWYSNE